MKYYRVTFGAPVYIVKAGSVEEATEKAQEDFSFDVSNAGDGYPAWEGREATEEESRETREEELRNALSEMADLYHDLSGSGDVCTEDDPCPACKILAEVKGGA